MAQPALGQPQMVTRTYRTDIGPAWWAALLVVTLVLGVLARGDGGFWSAFLWSVVGFVVGSLVAIAVSSRQVRARSEDEAFADLDGLDGLDDLPGSEAPR
jgi:hypothetical protein